MLVAMMQRRVCRTSEIAQCEHEYRQKAGTPGHKSEMGLFHDIAEGNGTISVLGATQKSRQKEKQRNK